MLGGKRQPKANVGIIGLGIIGSRVAAMLRGDGWPTFVWNRTPRPQPNFLGSPSELAGLCKVIQLFVADGGAVMATLQAMRGELTPAHTVLCHATIGPAATEEAAELVQSTGAAFLDAPFTGSKLAAEKRGLTYYIGGDSTVLERVRPVLESSSKAIVPVGTIGQAAIVKLITNMIAAVSTQALAEAQAIALRAGLTPEALGRALEHNAARSGTMDLKLPKFIAADYDPHFSLKHMLKDMRLGMQLANALGVDAPASTVTTGLLYAGLNKGWADLDFAALFRHYEGALAPVAVEANAELVARAPETARPVNPPSSAAPSTGELDDVSAFKKLLGIFNQEEK